MPIKRPATMEAYMDLVDQAVFEAQELRASVEFDEEFMEAAHGFVGPLEEALLALQQSLRDGSYEFEDKDLPFMSISEPQPQVYLPFKTLLRLINETHRKGLATEETAS